MGVLKGGRGRRGGAAKLWVSRPIEFTRPPTNIRGGAEVWGSVGADRRGDPESGAVGGGGVGVPAGRGRRRRPRGGNGRRWGGSAPGGRTGGAGRCAAPGGPGGGRPWLRGATPGTGSVEESRDRRPLRQPAAWERSRESCRRPPRRPIGSCRSPASFSQPIGKRASSFSRPASRATPSSCSANRSRHLGRAPHTTRAPQPIGRQHEHDALSCQRIGNHEVQHQQRPQATPLPAAEPMGAAQRGDT